MKFDVLEQLLVIIVMLDKVIIYFLIIVLLLVLWIIMSIIYFVYDIINFVYGFRVFNRIDEFNPYIDISRVEVFGFIIDPNDSFVLLYLMLIVIVGIVLVLFIPSSNVRLIKFVSSIVSIIAFLWSIFIYGCYDYSCGQIQFYSRLYITESINTMYKVGVDGISLNLILLTTFLMFISIFSSWDSIKFRVKEFYLLMLLLEFIFLNVFAVLDLFLFYISFELVLVPMFMVVGIWGSRDRKIHAAYQFFYYTLVGSLIMLLGIIVVYVQVGSTDYFDIVNHEYSTNLQIILWLSFFCSIGVKIPIVPFHIWLPEAHVEAPTSGSIILAGIVLKLGGYALLRFSMPMFPDGTKFFTPIVVSICIVSIIYASFSTMRQVDLKKVIAYSSVAHMNFALIGIMCSDVYGIAGGMYLMLGHGVVSSGLFYCVGILYDRYGTRSISYYGSLVSGMPIYSFFFLLLTLANLGFPGFMNFIGEFNILIAIFNYNTYAGFLSMSGIIFSAVYSILLYNRIVFGKLKGISILKFSDINRREFFCLLLLVVAAIYFGVDSSMPLGTMYQDVSDIHRLYDK